MSAAIVRELLAALEAPEDRHARARRAAEIICVARGYRWAGVYEVDDDCIGLLGQTGNDRDASVAFSVAKGLIGEAVRTRRTVLAPAGSQMIVPILGAESGIAIGTLEIESQAGGALSDEDRDFAEACAGTLIALFE